MLERTISFFSTVELFRISINPNPILVGGRAVYPRLIRFFNNSVRRSIIVLKFLDFLLLPMMQLLTKFRPNILAIERERDIFLGLTLEKSQVLKPQISRKNSTIWIFCKLLLGISVIWCIMFGWNCTPTLILCNFSDFG